MAIDLRNGNYACSICGQIHSSALRADKCRDNHDMLYIPMSKKEFNLLLHAIAFEDMSVIPESLRKTFGKYQRMAGK